MSKEHMLFIFRVLCFSAVIVFVGGMFNYFPFLGAVEFCTVVVCGVIAVCTCMILSAIDKK